MQANSISNAYCTCFRENKVQEKGCHITLINIDYRPSCCHNYKMFKRHSALTSCKDTRSFMLRGTVPCTSTDCPITERVYKD